jgi:hypothetical protein
MVLRSDLSVTSIFGPIVYGACIETRTEDVLMDTVSSAEFRHTINSLSAR